MLSLDSRGEVSSTLWARIAEDADGRPRLEAAPGQVGRWNAVLKRHAGKGPIRLTLSRQSSRRSSGQNRLLWGVVYPQILEGLREQALERNMDCPFANVEQLHEALKHRFLGATVVRWGAESFKLPPSTVVLSIEAFSVYVRQVVEQAAKWGCYVEMQESA